MKTMKLHNVHYINIQIKGKFMKVCLSCKSVTSSLMPSGLCSKCVEKRQILILDIASFISLYAQELVRNFNVSSSRLLEILEKFCDDSPLPNKYQKTTKELQDRLKYLANLVDKNKIIIR